MALSKKEIVGTIAYSSFDNKKARLPLEIMVVDGLVFHTFPESAKEMYGNDFRATG